MRLGEWDLNNLIDCYEGACAPPAQDIMIEEKIPHESYIDRGSRYNDIALLRLAKKIEYSGLNISSSFFQKKMSSS